MKDATPQAVYLKDYQRSAYSIEQVEMKFELFEDYTLVTGNLAIRQRELAALVLHGEELELLSLQLNGQEIPRARYQLTAQELTLDQLPRQFNLQTRVRIRPQNNKALEGLYKSGQIFCTQCEAEGFRRMTYFLDRPDVMAKYRVRIEGDRKKYPLLLSNGNPVERGELPGGRHFVTWEDPFKKPSYLFALVAGDLGVIKDQYITMSGRTVALEIYCDKGNEQRCFHAMESLKKSMQWDEQEFGREYDLDIYMIVAVDAFNMGAMENKGLNIFNSYYILADPKSATDQDYQTIEGIIGHEYFHNWTGNRITCRDWFQLTLKEGLTVYRDQEFSADMQSRPVKRIADVKYLQQRQFSEDTGPMAHPIRPQSYMKIDNFYTNTVYNKGAEVIRMVANLIGKEQFRKGMDKYFELYDGQAVTTEDFLYAMELASGHDLAQFQETWYHQAGTPEVQIQMNKHNDGIDLLVHQSTPTQKANRPFYLPFPVAFYNQDGQLLEQRKLILSRQKESFHFSGMASDAIPSFNLGFAAPVKVIYDYSNDELMFLMKFDRDDYNRFQATQRFAMRELLKIKDQIQEDAGATRHPSCSAVYRGAYRHLLLDEKMDMALKAYGLKLPSFEEVIAEQAIIDFIASEKARRALYRELATRFYNELLEYYHALTMKGAYQLTSRAISQRLLRNTVLALLAERADEQVIALISRQYDSADNMTDTMAAFQAIVNHDHPERERISSDFYQKWHRHSVVYSKWLRVMAGGRFTRGLDHIKSLLKDPHFDLTIPTQVYSLWYGLESNPLAFHDARGEGYYLLAGFIKKYDRMNPQTCARLAGLFHKYPVMADQRRCMVKAILEDLKDSKLSLNTYEVVEKTLQSASSRP